MWDASVRARNTRDVAKAEREARGVDKAVAKDTHGGSVEA